MIFRSAYRFICDDNIVNKLEKHNDSVAINIKSIEDIRKLYNYLLCAWGRTMLNIETLKRYLELARVSKATYAGPIRHSIYTYEEVPFENQKIIHGSFGRGYCRIFWNSDTVVIAFRGTRESVDWAISNLKAFPVPLRDCQEASGILVHRGFQKTLDYGDKTTELRSLDAIIDYLNEYELLNRKLVITGHSLGGALAILFAVKFRSLYPDEMHSNLDRLITFGSPEVGFGKFKEFYGELAEKTVRVVNNADAVPFTPPVFYKHVGTEFWLQKDGLSTNVGWPTRLKNALKGPLSKLSSDHSMVGYIEQLHKVIKSIELHNNPIQPTAKASTD
jgi:pimeloyl-ACP methyl ester carboxylesterase